MSVQIATARPVAHTDPRPVDPDSITAKLAGDWRLILLSFNALLLQTCHPVIGGALVDHSVYTTDPWGRFDRSWWPTLALAFYGDRTATYGRDIRAMHKKIGGVDHQGRRYHAWDPEAYLFVLATGFNASEILADLFDRPLTQRQREELYEGYRRMALLVGLAERDIPANLTAFRQFYDGVINERLEFHPSTGEFLALIERPMPPPRVPAALWHPVSRLVFESNIKVLTVGTLPPVIRERLRLSWTPADERRLRRFVTQVRLVHKVLPPPVRQLTRTVALRRQDEIMATAAHNAHEANR
jgi:uncharacterized protein (DUF2236 family)